MKELHCNSTYSTCIMRARKYLARGTSRKIPFPPKGEQWPPHGKKTAHNDEKFAHMGKMLQ